MESDSSRKRHDYSDTLLEVPVFDRIVIARSETKRRGDPEAVGSYTPLDWLRCHSPSKDLASVDALWLLAMTIAVLSALRAATR